MCNGRQAVHATVEITKLKGLFSIYIAGFGTKMEQWPLLLKTNKLPYIYKKFNPSV